MLRMPIRNTRSVVTDKVSPKPLKDNECYAVTDKTPENTPKSACSLMTCAQCGRADGTVQDYLGDGGVAWLHARCADAYAEAAYAARVADQDQADDEEGVSLDQIKADWERAHAAAVDERAAQAQAQADDDPDDEIFKSAEE
jgi:hypothetical protein